MKTKKDKYQTMNIEKTMLNYETNSLFSGTYILDTDIIKKKNKKGNIKKINKKNKAKTNNKIYLFRNLKLSEDLKDFNICDSSITHNQRLSEFYLNLNYVDNEEKDKDILINNKVCAIDPGVNCFVTIFSDNRIDKIGLNIYDKIKKICNEIDIMSSKIYKKKDGKFKYKSNKRRNIRKALHKKIKYLDNLKKELHNKVIAFLIKTYGKIIYPPFETQGMVGKLNSNLSRSLCNLSFYEFKQKLMRKCKEYNIELSIRPEYYTSKTCTRCGNIKRDLKGERIYECKVCGLKIDRDFAGSRNIMLKNM
jgi:transposase